MSPRKASRLGLRLSPKTHEALLASAKKRDITTSQCVRYALADFERFDRQRVTALCRKYNVPMEFAMELCVGEDFE